MKIYDEANNIIENPDLELGKLLQESKSVVFKYEITTYEQGHYETIAEYPNGGKDIEWVVDVAEEGNWIAYDENGEVVETDIAIPSDAPHELNIPSTHEWLRYVLYTDEELAEIAAQKEVAEQEQITIESQQAQIADQQAQIEEQAAAIEELAAMLAALEV